MMIFYYIIKWSFIKMDSSIKKLIHDTLKLPYELRAYLAEKLLESLDTGEGFKISKEWKQEIEQRCLDIDKNNTMLKDSDEVFNNVYKEIS